ncbi:Phosphoserine aminotransferase [Diplonema papillatum]|nr:Phosphoserine aminotransferase [Diplonema papillatum]
MRAALRHIQKRATSKVADDPMHVAYKEVPSTGRVMNLSAGNAALPLEVLQKAQKEFVNWKGKSISVAELGYRTGWFHEVQEGAEQGFREVLNIPDTHEVFFFNGGATLQFAAMPMNLMGGAQPTNPTRPKVANYVMNGHWSEKASREAELYCKVNRVATDKSGLYFTVPEPETWDIDKDGVYMHYTSADTRQGFEFIDFPYEVVPEGMLLCSDQSADLGSKPVDWSKYAYIYAAAHKNFSTSGFCLGVIRKDIIKEETIMPCAPTMCRWKVFNDAPNKIWNVPVIVSVWMAELTLNWMKERGGLPYFEDLAKRRSRLLYDAIDGSGGFYKTFVTDERYRSRMQVVFTIGDGTTPRNVDLVNNFLHKASAEMGWLDIRSHPLGIPSDAIRVTMYNPQPIEHIQEVQKFMHQFMKENQ